MLAEIGSKPLVGASLPVQPWREDLCLLSFHHPLSQVLPVLDDDRSLQLRSYFDAPIALSAYFPITALLTAP